jgi:hypothetical protein
MSVRFEVPVGSFAIQYAGLGTWCCSILQTFDVLVVSVLLLQNNVICQLAGLPREMMTGSHTGQAILLVFTINAGWTVAMTFD